MPSDQTTLESFHTYLINCNDNIGEAKALLLEYAELQKCFQMSSFIIAFDTLAATQAAIHLICSLPPSLKRKKS